MVLAAVKMQAVRLGAQALLEIIFLPLGEPEEKVTAEGPEERRVAMGEFFTTIV